MSGNTLIERYQPILQTWKYIGYHLKSLADVIIMIAVYILKV